MRVHHPREEPVALQARVLLVDLQRALDVVGDVLVAERGARGAARLPRPAPVQLADLQEPVVAAAVVLRRRIEAGLVEGDAHPGGDVVALHAEQLQVARQLAAVVDARAGQRGQRTHPQRDGEHFKCVCAHDERARYFIQTTTRRAECVAPVLTVILIEPARSVTRRSFQSRYNGVLALAAGGGTLAPRPGRARRGGRAAAKTTPAHLDGRVTPLVVNVHASDFIKIG